MVYKSLSLHLTHRASIPPNIPPCNISYPYSINRSYSMSIHTDTTAHHNKQNNNAVVQKSNTECNSEVIQVHHATPQYNHKSPIIRYTVINKPMEPSIELLQLYYHQYNIQLFVECLYESAPLRWSYEQYNELLIELDTDDTLHIHQFMLHCIEYMLYVQQPKSRINYCNLLSRYLQSCCCDVDIDGTDKLQSHVYRIIEHGLCHYQTMKRLIELYKIVIDTQFVLNKSNAMYENICTAKNKDYLLIEFVDFILQYNRQLQYCTIFNQQFLSIIPFLCHKPHSNEIFKLCNTARANNHNDGEIDAVVSEFVAQLIVAYRVPDAIQLIHKLSYKVEQFPELQYCHYKNMLYNVWQFCHVTDFYQPIVSSYKCIDQSMQLYNTYKLLHSLIKQLHKQRDQSHGWLIKHIIERYHLLDDTTGGLYNDFLTSYAVVEDAVYITERGNRNHNIDELPLYTVDDHTIIFVNTTELLDDACNDLLQCSIIGLDAEFIRTDLADMLHTDPCQILQLSTDTMNYVVDLCYIVSDQNVLHKLHSTLQSVFGDERITKIGMTFDNDMKQLKSIFHGQYDINNYIECNTILKHIRRTNNNNNQTPIKSKSPTGYCGTVIGNSSNKGLSLLVKLILSQYLDKNETMSNWANRPLRHDQLQYAACDARCQIDVYNKLKSQNYQFVTTDI